MRIGKGIALALVLATLGNGAVRAITVFPGEDLNEYVPLPSASMTGGATSFTIVIQGDVTSVLNLSSTESNPGLNPFEYVNENIVGSGTTSVTADLNGDGNTVVTFTGSNPILSSYSFDFGNSLPHLGLSSTDTSQVIDVLSQSWSNGTTTTMLPSLSAGLGAAPTRRGRTSSSSSPMSSPAGTRSASGSTPQHQRRDPAGDHLQ